MVVAAAVPVLNAQGQMCGLLYGGNLLNRRYEIVDAIRQQVFRATRYQGGPQIGAVTIFQGDLRILDQRGHAEDGSRAVGTRLSAAVCEEVLDRGGTWAAPALVVNDWYFTAYEPIRDPTGRIIGGLSAGLLQAPFVHQRDMISTVFLALIVGSAAWPAWSCWFVAMSLGAAAHPPCGRHGPKGDRRRPSARVGIRPAGEMGVLCRAVDSMAQAVAEREETAPAGTRQQIGRSEQLASVGRLAAGVAHEINNPLTGVLAFADLLREKENMDDQDRRRSGPDHPRDQAGPGNRPRAAGFRPGNAHAKGRLNVNDLVRQTLQLLGKREAFQNINLVEDLADHLPRSTATRTSCSRCSLNLSLNACEAMPNGGTLVSTSSADGRRRGQVTDTGSGIKPEHLDQIFEPFFTTKPVGKGTGLGLSVSYGIVQQHGGTLEVESQEGQGNHVHDHLAARWRPQDRHRPSYESAEPARASRAGACRPRGLQRPIPRALRWRGPWRGKSCSLRTAASPESASSRHSVRTATTSISLDEPTTVVDAAATGTFRCPS